MTIPYAFPSYPNLTPGGDSSSWEDVSSTPDIVPDFQKTYSLGWKFNYLRACFGHYYIDKSFKRDWANCRKTPMLLGTYMFLVWEQSPERQAEFFWNIVKDDPGELPLIVDFEWWSTIPENAFDLLYRCLERLKQLSGGKKKIGIYTAYSFWKQYGKNQTYWNQYYLWLAHYDNTLPIGEKQVPAPWKECFMWQFTGKGPGKYYGMESNEVDLDFFMGTLEDLYKFCELSTIPEIPPTDDDNTGNDDNNNEDSTDMIKMQVQSNTLNIRTGPGMNYFAKGKLSKGDIITVYDVAGKNSAWVKISPDQDSWSCVQDSGFTYLKKIQ